MPLKLSFSKVALVNFSRKAEHGMARFSAVPTKTVAKAMGWGDFPDWCKSSQPAGTLTASIAELIPAQDELKKQAIELSITTVRDFEIIKTQVKKGKTANKAPSFKTELHFAVDFTDPNGARKLEAYMQAAGESTLRVTYEKQAELELEPDLGVSMDDIQKRRAAGEEE